MSERKKVSIVGLILEYNVVAVLILLIGVSIALSDVFFTWGNITNLLRQMVPLTLVATGMIIVVLTGGIDLSVGSVAAVGSVTCAILVSKVFASQGYFGLILAIVIALAAGVLAGGIMGSLVAYFRMAPFVASLAMMTIARGAAYIITNGEPIRLSPSAPAQHFLADIGSKSIPLVKLPWPILVGIIVVVIFHLTIKYTKFGRLAIATGSNESAVRLAGIMVQKYKLAVYMISGFLSALAGIMITARSGVGVPISGAGLELDALAACVIGGASLSGGKGKIVNTVIGVLVLGLISNIMNLLSVPAYPQQIIKGVIIIAAVLLQGIDKKN